MPFIQRQTTVDYGLGIQNRIESRNLIVEYCTLVEGRQALMASLMMHGRSLMLGGRFPAGVPWAPSRPGRRPGMVRSASEPSEKNLDVMRKFSEQYARRSGTFFCVDKGVTSVVIKGLAEHKDTLGAPLCPCRHYDDKQAEVEQGFWNCPCVPMRERKECHCMLFLTTDNDFAGDEQKITMDEIKELTANF